MKNFSKILTVFVMLFAAFLVSCDKDVETTALTADNLPTATIVGTVYGEFDLTSYESEVAPIGDQDLEILVILTIPYSDLGLSSSGSYIDTVKLDSNGSFSVKVPTDADGATVSIKIVDFVFNQQQEFDNQHQLIKKLYSGTDGDYSYDVKPNDTQIQDIYLDSPSTLGEVYDWYTVTGTIYADYNRYTDGNEKLPAGTKVTFNTSGWSQEVTVGTDGKYSISVPYGEYIYCSYNFSIAGKLADNTSVTYRYKDTSNMGYFYDNADDENIYLGTGVAE